MIVDHMMLARAISNHDKIHINRKPFQELCNDTKTCLKNPLLEGAMNFTMSQRLCQSQLFKILIVLTIIRSVVIDRKLVSDEIDWIPKTGFACLE